jgi:hypothetical protein
MSASFHVDLRLVDDSDKARTACMRPGLITMKRELTKENGNHFHDCPKPLNR